MFNRKKKKKEEKAEVVEPIIDVGREGKYEKAPFFVKSIIKFKFFLSDTDPTVVTTYMIFIILGGTFIGAVFLPFLGVIGEIPNKVPFCGGVTIAALSWWARGIYDVRVKERICVLSFNGENYYVDNCKVVSIIGGELLFLLNRYGKPLYNQDGDDPRRYNTQKTLFVEKIILSQFGSVRGHTALSYSDCRRIVVSMNRIDYSIKYTPRSLNEEQLLDSIDVLKTKVSAKDVEITQLKTTIAQLSKDYADTTEKIGIAPLKTSRKMREEAGYDKDLKAIVEIGRPGYYKKKYQGDNEYEQ